MFQQKLILFALAFVLVISEVSGLKAGDAFQIRNAYDYYGPLVMEGVYDGSGSVSIQMKQYIRATPYGTGIPEESIPKQPGPSFGAFALIKK